MTARPASNPKLRQGLELFAYALTGAALATLVVALLETSEAAHRAASEQAAIASADAQPRPCPLSASPEACDACMLSSCLDACRACAGNPSCLELFDCMMACKGAACERGCVARHPEGKGDLAAFVGQRGCLVQRCSAACP